MAMLNNGSSDAFAASYNELKGDIFFKQGNIIESRNAYKNAIAAAAKNSVDTSVIQIKLDNLAGTNDSL